MDNEKQQDEWLDWPDKPGYYWFFGYSNSQWARKHGDKPELQPVVAKYGANKTIIVHYWAAFLYKSQAVGKYLYIEAPDTPELPAL